VLQRPQSVPDAPGSYQFKDSSGRIIYVGKARSLRSRLSNYFQDPVHLHPRTAQMVERAASVEWIVVGNDVEAIMLEYNLIKAHRPRFNIRLVDDKSYPYQSHRHAGGEAKGHPVLWSLRARLCHQGDARPALKIVPDPDMF
jgi:excinuclease UvrABC nuclease subunit